MMNGVNMNKKQLQFVELAQEEFGVEGVLTRADVTKIVDENNLAYVIRDGFAVTKHHTLIIPKRHVKDYFELSQAEINAVTHLINNQKSKLDKLDKSR